MIDKSIGGFQTENFGFEMYKVVEGKTSVFSNLNFEQLENGTNKQFEMTSQTFIKTRPVP